MAIFGIPLWRRKRDPVTPPGVTVPGDLPELTPEEIRNGWTAVALKKYRAEADELASDRIMASMERRQHSQPTTCDTDYPVFGR